MLNVFSFYGRVRSEPVFLGSKKTGNRFAKFTASIDGDTPHFVRKMIEEKKGESGNFGEVYVDFLSFADEKDRMPGQYVLKNLHKYDLIAGTGKLSAGQKPVKDEPMPFMEELMNFIYSCNPPDGMTKKEMADKVRSICGNNAPYRSNWVYGDYLYVQLEKVYLIKPYNPKQKSPYSGPYKPNFGEPPKKDFQSRGMVSYDQRVNDDDLIFSLD